LARLVLRISKQTFVDLMYEVDSRSIVKRRMSHQVGEEELGLPEVVIHTRRLTLLRKVRVMFLSQISFSHNHELNFADDLCFQ
jgi:hypothetical protein